jgi:hypothetical protein
MMGHMANEFYYCISLSIVHPTIDPAIITKAIPELRPKIETMAGTIRRDKGNKPIVPERTASLSHWLAELHPEEKLYSGSKPICEFIFERLNDLDPHRDLFAHLRKAGQVSLRIGWFMESNYSAELLDAETLRRCGELGLDVELNVYAMPV